MPGPGLGATRPPTAGAFVHWLAEHVARSDSAISRSPRRSGRRARDEATRTRSSLHRGALGASGIRRLRCQHPLRCENSASFSTFRGRKLSATRATTASCFKPSLILRISAGNGTRKIAQTAFYLRAFAPSTLARSSEPVTRLSNGRSSRSGTSSAFGRGPPRPPEITFNEEADAHEMSI